MTDCEGCIYNDLLYCGHALGPLLLSELDFCPYRKEAKE